MDFFVTRSSGRLHPALYDVISGSFALTRLWDCETLSGPERGRAFEGAFYGFCEGRGLRLTERAGSRTLCGSVSASGLRHESDAVIVLPDIIIHVETKHLGHEVSKNDLMIFNQKGLDFMMSGATPLTARPLYRVFLSGGPLSPEARRFALLWGIVAVEPDVLPLPVLHWLAGSSFAEHPGFRHSAERIWRDVPVLVASLQERIRRLPSCLEGHLETLSRSRIERYLEDVQMACGDRCWRELDYIDPFWLENIYSEFSRHLPRLTKMNWSSALVE
ncbi:hypothetical protein [Mesorhizobium sp. LNHC252B00]|uniref:hypothetical protein n=1 Tax=Mesorhizobium sp. LNHC252B00 TaxID=1287252 RepID=UPI0004138352|nr:hypothetical protein [Mesorhizobium sp. LNHC252B00]